ncbi:hypothetical protein, partial [Gluconobacter sp. Gdi]
MAGGNPLKAAFYEVPNAVSVLGGFGKAVETVGGLMMGPVGIVAGVVATGVAMYKLGSYAEAESEQLATLSQH